MPIIIKHKEPRALQKTDSMSSTRELYIDRQLLVELTIEMDVPLALRLFNKLPEHILPPLPHGYQWVKANNNYSIIRNAASKEHQLLVVLYGPDKENHINFICQIDNQTSYSFGQTKPGTGPAKRTYPMTSAHFKVPGYDYSEKKYKGHVRGHLIDHQDSILDKTTVSTYDHRNFVPEPPEYEWGLGFRRVKVNELRKKPGGGAYAQLNMYSARSLKTANGTTVPDDARFYTYSANDVYTAEDVYHVDFEENLKRPLGTSVLAHAANTFISSIAASPVVVAYSPESTERGLRAHARAAIIKEQNISARRVVSRFMYKDTLYATCVAGDLEFESAGRQLHAGVFAKKEEGIALEYIKRSLFFGDKLADLDQNISFSSEEIQEGTAFFKDQNGEMNELSDHFHQLCSDRTRNT